MNPFDCYGHRFADARNPDMHIDDLPKTVSTDFIRSICGKKLGTGMSRQVYVFDLDDDLVIKMEVNACFQNVLEWETWRALKDTPHAKWLAPCKWISRSGNALIMARTKPISLSEAPKQLPEWIADHKLENFGWLGKQVVCHDYGSTGGALLNHGAFRGRMRKIKWHQPGDRNFDT